MLCFCDHVEFRKVQMSLFVEAASCVTKVLQSTKMEIQGIHTAHEQFMISSVKL